MVVLYEYNYMTPEMRNGLLG